MNNSNLINQFFEYCNYVCVYYDYYLMKIIIIERMNNANQLCYSPLNQESYNFKVGDAHLNRLLFHYYKEYYPKSVTNDNLNKIDKGVLNNFEKLMTDDLKYKLIEPKSVTEDPDKYTLQFELTGWSNIYGNENPATSNTKFKLYEKKNITKDKYAYIVLYFPNYDSQGNQKNDYLLSTLMVAYSLKNNFNNYDLSKKSIKGTKAKVICMTTCDTDAFSKELLKVYFDEVKVVPFIGPQDCPLPANINKKDPNNFIWIQDVSKGKIPKNHGYYKVFTKLNIFNKILFPYEKVILLDSDLFTMGYFDTLFSIDTPAGCIEHKRLLLENLGISSWITDRNPFCKHSKPIPRILTDVENMCASDINASLLIISPNTETFNSLIGELKTPLHLWFAPDKYHKGFWLGNSYYDYYMLPEQNYLTKRFSGAWKSVDLGFTTWLIDLDTAFGFTFAGFVVKPWKTQSAFHLYTINPISQFSKINNKLSQRSYGYQLINNLLFNMVINLQSLKNNKYANFVKSEIGKTSIIFQPFDPWEPEVKLDLCPSKKIGDIMENDLVRLSYDQKRLVYLCNNNINKDKLKKIIYFDYMFDNIARNIYNLHFSTLTYQLLSDAHNVCSKFKVFPFNNTVTSLQKFGSLDIIDNSNSLLVIFNKKDFKTTIAYIILEFIKLQLQVYICLKNTNKFMRVLPNNMPSNIVEKLNKNDYMFYDYFINTFDMDNLKFFNVSYPSQIVDQIIHNHNIKLQKNMMLSIQGNYHVKLPWLDIFYAFDNNGKIEFDKVSFSHDTFFSNNTVVNEYITDKKFKMPNIQKYLLEHYGSSNKLQNYNIKTINLSGQFEKTILFDISRFINSKIKNLYAASSIKKIYI